MPGNPMCAKIGLHMSRSGWSSRVRSLPCTEQIEERNTDLSWERNRDVDVTNSGKWSAFTTADDTKNLL